MRKWWGENWFIYGCAVIVVILVAGAIFYAYAAPKRNIQLQAATDLYEGVPLDARLLELDKKALDAAYHNQMVNLFSVWLKSQITDPKARDYFHNGITNARRSYNDVAQQLARREKELQLLQQQRPQP